MVQILIIWCTLCFFSLYSSFSFFLKLCIVFQATCPTLGALGLPPTELEKEVRQRLAKPDLAPESGCSGAFKDSLTSFMAKCIRTASFTRSILGLPLDSLGSPDQAVHEQTATNISGLTLRQLEVNNILMLCSFIVLSFSSFTSCSQSPLMQYLSIGIRWCFLL